VSNCKSKGFPPTESSAFSTYHCTVNDEQVATYVTNRANLRPPPQGSAAQPPPSKADTGINLISMEDLLISEPVKQTPPTTVAESSAIDLDFFSTPQPVSTAPAPAPAAGVGSPDAAPKASAMTEADFDAFLNTITHSK